jgi:hypothetical protein
MTLTGRDALDLVDKIRQENAKKRAENLARAKADSLARGKEPFDLAILEPLCAIDAFARFLPDEREERLEYMYYVDYPDVLTVSQFADKLDAFTRY